VGDQALITKVQAGSAGQAAGIKPGWVLVSAQGQKVERIARRLEERESHAPRYALRPRD
jgi:predicted metalloprotease with PDZ domain